MANNINNWQGVHNEALNRINSRHWKAGDLIPSEAELAREFGCARATVNRGLQSLADAGLLDRRRKVGTRVAIHPVRKATISIPIIKQEVEQRGLAYSYSLISNTMEIPSPNVRARLEIAFTENILHIEALHLADGCPYVAEDRWINIEAVPDAKNVDFSIQSPNQWLVENTPYTKGDIAFSAVNASQRECELLSCQLGDALFVVERRTWMKKRVITSANLTFAPRYRMYADI